MTGWCSHLRRSFAHIQCALYLLSFILGFFICIPVGITLRNFDGHCVLFAQLVWNNEYIYSWSETSCDFVLYFSLALCMFYSTFMVFFSLFAYLIPRRNTLIPSDKLEGKLARMHNVSARWLQRSMNPVMVLVNIIIAMMCLTCAILLTVGFAEFCVDLEKSMQEEGLDFNTCYEAQNLDWSKIKVNGGFDDGARGQNFHICLTIATIASWILFCVWTLLSILNLSHTCRGFSCETASEKQHINKQSMLVAARRSRMQTPIGTPRPALGPPTSQPGPTQPYGQSQYGQPQYQPQYAPRQQHATSNF